MAIGPRDAMLPHGLRRERGHAIESRLLRAAVQPLWDVRKQCMAGFNLAIDDFGPMSLEPLRVWQVDSGDCRRGD
ncbi:MAG: hypothetical protein ABIN96_01275, partial [Rubrivivax sp.]